MIQPKSNFHELFPQLERLLKSSSELSDFEVAAFKRDINKISDFSERTLLLALLYTLLNDCDKAITHYKKLIIAGVDDFVVNINYSSSLSQLNKNFLALEQLTKTAELFPNEVSLQSLLSFQIKFLDVESAISTANIIQEQVNGKLTDETIGQLLLLDVLNNFVENSDSVSHIELKEIGIVGIEIAEANAISFDALSIIKGVDSENLVVHYILSTNKYSVEDVERFNDELIEALIKQDLDLLPVVQQFSLLRENTSFSLVKDNGLCQSVL